MCTGGNLALFIFVGNSGPNLSKPRGVRDELRSS
jgi:hypothetical protein